jgi:hypothetical protein
MRRSVATILTICFMIAACDALNVPPFAPVECTLIGCDSLVVFEIPADLEASRTYDVEVCIDQRCESAAVEVPPRGVGLVGSFMVDAATDVLTMSLPEGDYSGVHAVSLTLNGADLEPVQIEVETEFERGQPNGPGCPPICWRAIIRA